MDKSIWLIDWKKKQGRLWGCYEDEIMSRYRVQRDANFSEKPPVFKKKKKTSSAYEIEKVPPTCSLSLEFFIHKRWLWLWLKTIAQASDVLNIKCTVSL